jgi:Leucine-rich repeat (LRR) protein
MCDAKQGIETLTALEDLTLAYNQLRAVPDLSRCTALAELNLSHNRLTAVKSMGAVANLMVSIHFSSRFFYLPNRNG